MILRKNQWTTEKPLTDFKACQGLIDWDPEGGRGGDVNHYDSSWIECIFRTAKTIFRADNDIQTMKVVFLPEATRLHTLYVQGSRKYGEGGLSRFIKRQKPGHSRKQDSILTPEYTLNHSTDVKSDLVLHMLHWKRMHKLHNAAVWCFCNKAISQEGIKVRFRLLGRAWSALFVCGFVSAF